MLYYKKNSTFQENIKIVVISQKKKLTKILLQCVAFQN